MTLFISTLSSSELTKDSHQRVLQVLLVLSKWGYRHVIVTVWLLSPIYVVSSSTVQFSSVRSLSRVRLFVTPWIAARQASLSITNSRNSLRLTKTQTHPVLLFLYLRTLHTDSST